MLAQDDRLYYQKTALLGSGIFIYPRDANYSTHFILEVQRATLFLLRGALGY